MHSRFLAPLLCCAVAACVAPRAQHVASGAHPARLEGGAGTMPDGSVLPLYRWLPASGTPRAAIVAVHGLNDWSESFAGTARFLTERGFAVYAYDQRGFGNAERRGLWAGGDRLADDSYEMARWVRDAHPNVPVFGLGESMGGAVLLRALARHPGHWLDGAALVAPAVWGRSEMPWYQRFALNTLSHTWRGLRLSGRGLGLEPSDNPETLRRLDEDPLVIRKTRVDVLAGVADLMDAVTTQPTYEVPLLVLYGAHDEIVPKNAFCAWAAHLERNDRWQLAVYPNGWHLLTRDLGATVVLTDLAAWYSEPRSSLPSRFDSADAQRSLCKSETVRQMMPGRS